MRAARMENGMAGDGGVDSGDLNIVAPGDACSCSWRVSSLGREIMFPAVAADSVGTTGFPHGRVPGGSGVHPHSKRNRFLAAGGL